MSIIYKLVWNFNKEKENTWNTMKVEGSTIFSSMSINLKIDPGRISNNKSEIKIKVYKILRCIRKFEVENKLYYS